MIQFQPVIGIGADHMLRQAVRLGQESPMKGAEGEFLVRLLPIGGRRDDVERHQAVDPVGIIQRQAIGHAGAAVMADDREIAHSPAFS